MDARRDWIPARPAPNSFLPNAAVVLLKQHAGPASRCLVARGERVHEGMLLGKADLPLSANVHAPVPGVVREIRPVVLPDGSEVESIVIALEGSFDRLGKREERYLWRSMAKKDILNTMRDRGVVDTEAPGIPLHDLVAKRPPPSILVLNAIESEPYLRSESCLLADKAAEIVEGLGILRKILSPERCVTALDAEAPEAVAAAFAKDSEAAELAILEPRYPQDMEGQLLEALCGQRGADPARALIVRPSTVFALYESIVLAKPMLERYVTVAGGAIKRPGVFKTRIGTRIGDLIEECGGFLGMPARLLIGGPIRGHAVYDLDAPVTKTSSAVIALSAEEVGSARRDPCIRCGRCVDACPEDLDPDLLYRLLDRRLYDQAFARGLGRCTLCGACAYSCPSRLPLVAAFSAHRAIREPAAGTQRRSGLHA